jgi:pimeloyl-ACP methyl ester carboxylesterase
MPDLPTFDDHGPHVRGSVDRPDGTRLFTLDAGDGSTVLLVHGFGLTHGCWEPVSSTLVAAGYRTIAYDHRGHGFSTVGRDGVGSAQLCEDLRAVLRERDLTDVILTSHSMGTFVSLAALDDPDIRKRVRHLILVNPITGGPDKGATTARLQGPLVRSGVAQWLARSRPVGNAMARMSLGQNASSEVVEATRRALAAIPHSATPMVKVLRTESVSAGLGHIDTPTTVLASSNDKTTPDWHARLIVASMPSARLEYVAGAGHMTPWEAPQRIVAAVNAASAPTGQRD